jgi:hypothetical protein
MGRYLSFYTQLSSFNFMRIFLFLAFACFFIGSASAQDVLTGRVYEYKTTNAVPGVSIRNLRTNNTAISDRTGAFSIPAKVGDLVLFMGFSYQADTLYVKDLKYTEVQMLLKGRTLDEVKVTGQETRLGNLKPTPTLSPFGGQTVVYQTDPKGNYTGGLRMNIFDSHSAANKRQHAIQTEKDEAIKTKIAGIFSPEGLKDYVPFKGQELQNFITMYTPDIATYTAPDFNLTTYISTCYQEFMKIPAEERQSASLTNLTGKDN